MRSDLLSGIAVNRDPAAPLVRRDASAAGPLLWVLVGTLIALAGIVVVLAWAGWIGVLAIGGLAGGLIMTVVNMVWFAVAHHRRWID